MASAGLLFLMLMSSSFLISTGNVTTATADQNQLQENSPKKFNTAKIISKTLNFIEKITQASSPFMSLIPNYGVLVNALFSLMGFAAKEINQQINVNSLKAIMDEFENLNVKLNQYHVEQKWDTWASGAYHKPEKNIAIAWTSLMTLVHSLDETKDSLQRERHKKSFMDTYSKYEPATKILHKLLTAEGVTFINPLGDLLAEHVKCHEKDIRQYTILIYTLIYRGNIMNQFYYKYMKIESQKRVDEEAKIAYEIASVMFQVHKKCIINSMEYIKNDLETLISKTQTRLELTKKVRSFLQEVYDRYDWVVVAFITKKSKHEIFKTLNSHVMSGFTEVTKEGISVAIARQVKGNYTKAAMVKEAIDKCTDKSDLCYKVAEKLSKCRVTVESKPVTKTFTAVHAYLRETPKEALYEDYDISTAPEDMSNQTPYIYKGKCQKSPGVQGGKFVVFIKSDEEIMSNDPCSKLNCGMDKRGKCVHVKDVFLAMCECKMPYYGEQCEGNLEDYKKDLEEKILGV